MNFLEKPFDPYSDKFIVVGTNNNFKTIEASDSSNVVSFSSIQDEITNSIVAAEESSSTETTAPETQETKKGSITLTGKHRGTVNIHSFTAYLNN